MPLRNVNVSSDNATCDCNKMTNEDIKKAEKLDNSKAIKVLGPGCSNCNKLKNNTEEAINKMNLDEEVDYITDFKEISLYGVMSTPALVIKGKVVSMGKVLKVDEIVELINENY